jgi:hypothetical protein
VSQTENLGRCQRCGRFMIAEERKNHKCDFADVAVRGCEELVLDHLTDSGRDKHGDQLYLAWALDGMLYRILVCKHNPSHSAKRIVTDLDEDQTKRRGDVTLVWTLRRQS